VLDANVATTNPGAFGFSCTSARMMIGLDFECGAAPTMDLFFFLGGGGGRAGGLSPNFNMIDLSFSIYILAVADC
jgi:hypothetical protein